MKFLFYYYKYYIFVRIYLGKQNKNIFFSKRKQNQISKSNN